MFKTKFIKFFKMGRNKKNQNTTKVKDTSYQITGKNKEELISKLRDMTMNNSCTNKEKNDLVNITSRLVELEYFPLEDNKDIFNKLRVLKGKLAFPTDQKEKYIKNINLFENSFTKSSDTVSPSMNKVVTTSINVKTPRENKSDKNVGDISKRETNKTKSTTENKTNNIELKNISKKLDSIDSEIIGENSQLVRRIKRILSFDIISREIGNMFESLESKFSKSTNSLSNGISNLDNKISNINSNLPKDYLKKEDFSFEINQKLQGFEELKEMSENLETIPAKFNNLDSRINEIGNKIDEISKSSNNTIPSNIPKEEKAILELSRYMQDGIKQFEDISKLYVTKQHELQNLDNIKDEQVKLIDDARKVGRENGAKSERIKLAKDILSNFPSDFNNIKSLFEDVSTFKLIEGDEIDVNNDNKNDLMPFIDGEVSIGKCKITKSAILIGGKVVQKAEIKKIEN